jgi:hypothetical protein
LKSSASGTTVDFIDNEENVGYQLENWNAITSLLVRVGQVVNVEDMSAQSHAKFQTQRDKVKDDSCKLMYRICR